MKNSIMNWSLASILVLAGCASGASGGPGAVDMNKQPIVGQADETFQLSAAEAVLRQGETKSVSITIKRALNFEEDVTLRFAELPKGLTMDNATPRIKHGDSEARF